MNKRCGFSLSLFLSMSLLVVGCAGGAAQTTDEPATAQQERAATSRPMVDLDGTLWMQSAAEYHAATRQAFGMARFRLTQALDQPDWTALPAQDSDEDVGQKPPAVIVDVDETVLDNSAYQARLLRNGQSFDPETWNAWCREAKAPAIPGAVEFAKFAADQGVTVFYVTNREHAVEEPTRRNLKERGFPMAEDRDVLLTKKEKESWGSDKTPRRRLIAEDFRIVLMIGDNLGDFLGETEVEAAKRRAKVAAHPDRWGKSWIVLPNPVYGDWEATTFGYDWSLERKERIKRKLNALETLEGPQP